MPSSSVQIQSNTAKSSLSLHWRKKVLCLKPRQRKLESSSSKWGINTHCWKLSPRHAQSPFAHIVVTPLSRNTSYCVSAVYVFNRGELGHGKGEAMEDHLFLWFGTRVKWFWRWLTRIFFRIPDSFRRLSWKPIWRNLNLGSFPDGKVHVGFFRTSGSPLELVNLFRAKHRKSACYAGYRFRCHAINLNISVTHLYSFGAKVAAELNLALLVRNENKQVDGSLDFRTWWRLVKIIGVTAAT